MNYHHPINNRLCEVWIISKSTWTLITFDLRLQPPIRVQSVRQGTLATQGCKNKLDTSRIGQIYQRQCQNHYRWRTDSLQICWVISGNVLCSNTCMAGYCAHLSHTLGAENRCFCHKNAQPKQTGPSSKNCGIQDSDSIYLCSSLLFQKIKEIVWHGHFSGKVIHRYIYNYCKKLGIKGHSAMHLTIAKMTMKFIYRMSTNSSVCEYIKFCVIFMERDILLLTSTKHT